MKVFTAWIVTDHLLMISVVSFHTTVTVPTGVKSTVYVRVHINQIFMTDFIYFFNSDGNNSRVSFLLTHNTDGFIRNFHNNTLNNSAAEVGSLCIK